jgi:hypothetical protein
MTSNARGQLARKLVESLREDSVADTRKIRIQNYQDALD